MQRDSVAPAALPSRLSRYCVQRGTNTPRICPPSWLHALTTHAMTACRNRHCGESLTFTLKVWETPGNPHGSLPLARKLPSQLDPNQINPFRQATKSELGLLGTHKGPLNQAFANCWDLPGLIPASNRAGRPSRSLGVSGIFYRISSAFACLQNFNSLISGPVQTAHHLVGPRTNWETSPSQPAHRSTATLVHDETWDDKKW